MTDPAEKSAIANLEAIASSADWLETSAVIRDKDGNDFSVRIVLDRLYVEGSAAEAGRSDHPNSHMGYQRIPNERRPFVNRFYRGLGTNSTHWPHGDERTYTFAEVMTCLATGLPDGELLVDTIKAKCKNGTIKGMALKQAALSAWCEAAGMPPPTGIELKSAKLQSKELASRKKAQIERHLRSGSVAIEAWNSKKQIERKV
jgi:hypothetical protein